MDKQFIFNKKDSAALLSHLMYQTKLNKKDLVEVFISWVRYAFIKYKEDGQFKIPYIGLFTVSTKENKVPIRGKHTKISKPCYYLRFRIHPFLKKVITSTSKDLLESLIDKIEKMYSDILDKT